MHQLGNTYRSIQEKKTKQTHCASSTKSGHKSKVIDA